MDNSSNNNIEGKGYDFHPSVSCAVDLFDDTHTRMTELAMGMSAVLEIDKYVKQGAEGAMQVTHDFSCNYDIVFVGTNLKVFLTRYYPNRLSTEMINAIDENKQYTVSSFDLS